MRGGLGRGFSSRRLLQGSPEGRPVALLNCHYLYPFPASSKPCPRSWVSGPSKEVLLLQTVDSLIFRLLLQKQNTEISLSWETENTCCGSLSTSQCLNVKELGSLCSICCLFLWRTSQAERVTEDRKSHKVELEHSKGHLCHLCGGDVPGRTASASIPPFCPWPVKELAATASVRNCELDHRMSLSQERGLDYFR